MKKQNIHRLRIAAILLACAAMAAALGGCGIRKASTSTQTRTAKVTRGAISVTVHGTGTIQPTSVQAVSSTVTGKVTQIFKQNGDPVNDGDNIAEVTATGTGATTDITAPMDGVVALSQLTVGTPVQPGMTVCQVQSAASFNAVVNVDELDIAGVKAGQKADVSVDAISGKLFSGTVQKISQVGVATNGVTDFSVTLSMDDSTGLMSNMSASADIHTGENQNALLVPVEALQTKGADRYLTVRTTSGKTTKDTQVKVSVGLISDTQAEITSGVNEGDTVVLPSLAPTNGTSINGLNRNSNSNDSSSSSGAAASGASSTASGGKAS